jgi:hypothetical protein
VSDTPAESTPDPAPKPANVIEAILAVMREVTVLPKTERNNSPGGNYNFRGIDSTVNALGPAMRKHGLVVLPELRKVEARQVVTTQNKTQTAHEVEVVYHFYGPGGVTDTVDAVVPGEAWDSGDKGLAKAMSVAERICLLQTFMLPTDERDPDLDTYEQAEPVKAEEVHALIKQAQDDADPAAFLIHHGNRIGEERLAQLTITVPDRTRGGEPVDLDAASVFRRWIAWYQQRDQHAAEAREARASQDAAEGPQVPVERAAPHPAPAIPSAPPAPARAAESDRPAATRWTLARAVRAEITVQAKALGVEPDKHAAPVLSQLGLPSFEQIEAAHVPAVGQFVVDQRPRVVEALMKAGNAVGATAYRGLTATQELPQAMFVQLMSGDIPDGEPAREPVKA